MATTKTTATAPAEVTSIPCVKKSRDPSDIKPYNRYNIYYILERERFLQSNSNYKRQDVPSRSNFTTGYEGLELPGFPPRYTNLDMPHDWYMPGKRKIAKRDHKKSHGLASFKDIARFVADGYRNIDEITLEYVTTVAKISKQRYNEIKAAKLKGFDKRLQPYLATMVDLTSTPSIDNNPVDDGSCNVKAKTSSKQYVTPSARLDHVPYLSAMTSLSISDVFVNSATTVSEATEAKAVAPIFPIPFPAPSISSGVPILNESRSATADASTSKVICIPPRTFSEVDIDDGDIIKMWHFN